MPPPDPAQSDSEGTASGTLQIFIQRPDGRSLIHRVNPTWSVATFRLAVRERILVPLSRLRLSFEGRPLDDQKTLAEYGVSADSTVHALIRAHDVTRSERDGLIHVKFIQSGYHTLVDCRTKDDVAALKKCMFKNNLNENNISHTFFFQDKPLKEGVQLKTYGIRGGCTLICKTHVKSDASAASIKSNNSKETAHEEAFKRAAERLRKLKEKEAAAAQKAEEAARREEERRQRENERKAAERNVAVAELEEALRDDSHLLQIALSTCRRLGCTASSHEVVAKAEKHLEEARAAAAAAMKSNAENTAAQLRAKAEEKERREREEQRRLAEAEKEAKAEKRRAKEEAEQRRRQEEQQLKQQEKQKQLEEDMKRKEEERRKREEAQQRREAERRKKAEEKASKVVERNDVKTTKKAKEVETQRHQETKQREAPQQLTTAEKQQVLENQVVSPTQLPIAKKQQVLESQMMSPTQAPIAEKQQLLESQMTSPTQLSIAEKQHLLESQMTSPTQLSIAEKQQLLESQMMSTTNDSGWESCTFHEDVGNRSPVARQYEAPTTSVDEDIGNRAPVAAQYEARRVRNSGVCPVPEPKLTIDGYRIPSAGYLVVERGSWLNVLYYQGSDEYEAEGWAFGEFLGDSSRRGWFPQRILAADTWELDGAGKVTRDANIEPSSVSYH